MQSYICNKNDIGDEYHYLLHMFRALYRAAEDQKRFLAKLNDFGTKIFHMNIVE